MSSLQLTAIARRTAAMLVCWVSVTTIASAENIYVDNREGRDIFNGATAAVVNVDTGPVRSIGRALELADHGDSIVIKNTEIPYFESIQLIGGRHSGSTNLNFTIVGNEAVLDGSRALPPYAWEPVEDNLWKFTPWRKGHFLLLLEGVPAPEHRISRDGSLSDLPEEHWCAWRGAIYYRSQPGEPPHDKRFRYAAGNIGIGLFGVEHVTIRDLKLRHFRLDGINAHDRCRNVTLENVIATENARAGLYVGGTSAVTARRCDLTGNRGDAMLITELGTVRLDETRIEAQAQQEQ